MPLFPLPVEQFGGLDLVNAPDEIGFSGAVDMLNVDLDQPGRLRSRDGFAKLTASAAVAAYHTVAPFYKTDGTKQLIAAFGGGSGAINALDTSGSVVAAQAAANTTYGSVARFAAPGSEYAYVSVAGTGAGTVYRWNGAAWATPTWSGTTPTGRHLATWQNRLANARYNGSANGNSPSTIRFSNIAPGPPPVAQPETWNANDFVELDPGDGEEITGMVRWTNYLFVFKETKFYVFYGVSTDASGNPIFNYRTIYGQGLASAGGTSAYRALTAGPEGVYFMNRRGVWLTTGASATLISRSVDPLFRGVGLPAAFSGSALNQGAISAVAMTWHDNRLYIVYPSGASTTNDRMLVYGPAGWLLWSIPAASICTFRIANVDELCFAFSGGLVTLSPPTASGSAAATGGSISHGTTYYYKVTATNAAGETTPSSEVTLSAPASLSAPTGLTRTDNGSTMFLSGSGSATLTYYVTAYNANGQTIASSASTSITNPTQQQHLSWSAVSGATGYKLYVNATGGMYPSHSPGSGYSFKDVGNVTSFDDNGAVPAWSAGSPPGAGTAYTDTNAFTVSWTAVSGATGYRVYRGTAAGSEDHYFTTASTSYTDTGTAGAAGTPPGSNTATTAGYDVGRYNLTSGYTLDGGDGLTTGAAIASSYQSGFDNIAPPRRFAAHYLFGNTRKRLRKWKVTGTGNVSFSVAHDFKSPGTATNLTLGVSPAITDAWHQIASRGQLFSYKFSGTGAWSVQKLTAYLAGSEPPLLGNPSDAS